MALPYYLVDSFSEVPFRGNPAAVVLMGSPRSNVFVSDALQLLAGEISSVETAYLFQTSTPSTHDYEVRFFTSKKENPFCGHAAFAAAHVLLHVTRRASGQVRLLTRGNGVVTISGDVDGTLTMTVAVVPVEAARLRSTDAVLLAREGLGLNGSEGDVVEILYHRNSSNVITVLSTPNAVKALSPKMSTLMEKFDQVLEDPVSRVTVIAFPTEASPRYRNADFVMRLFAPWMGITEDVLSAATQGVVAEYVARKKGKQTVRSLQCSPRGEPLVLEVLPGRKIVKITGKATLVARGEVIAPLKANL